MRNISTRAVRGAATAAVVAALSAAALAVSNAVPVTGGLDSPRGIAVGPAGRSPAEVDGAPQPGRPAGARPQRPQQLLGRGARPHLLAGIDEQLRERPGTDHLRALEPVEGIDEMVRLRTSHRAPESRPLKGTELCSGPARLCEALDIDLALNRIDLTADSRLWIERTRSRPLPAAALVNTPRIGVDYAGRWAQEPLRWYVRGNPHVSVASPSKR